MWFTSSVSFPLKRFLLLTRLSVVLSLFTKSLGAGSYGLSRVILEVVLQKCRPVVPAGLESAPRRVGIKVLVSGGFSRLVNFNSCLRPLRSCTPRLKSAPGLLHLLSFYQVAAADRSVKRVFSHVRALPRLVERLQEYRC